MLRTTILFLAIVLSTSNTYATSGWESHSVDIRGQYRIHGMNGPSQVHKIDGDGKILAPALCPDLQSGKVNVQLRIPADYATDDTHLYIRYSQLGSATEQFYYSIEFDTSITLGPFTYTEFEANTVGFDGLRWSTPWTPSNSGGSFFFYGILLFLGVVIFLAIYFVFSSLRWIIGCLAERKTNRRLG